MNVSATTKFSYYQTCLPNWSDVLKSNTGKGQNTCMFSQNRQVDRLPNTSFTTQENVSRSTQLLSDNIHWSERLNHFVSVMYYFYSLSQWNQFNISTLLHHWKIARHSGAFTPPPIQQPTLQLKSITGGFLRLQRLMQKQSSSISIITCRLKCVTLIGHMSQD